MTNNDKIRKRIYEIIELSEDNDKISQLYDIIMMFAIVVSLIPLMFRENNLFFTYSNLITTILFIIDYLLRFITADFKSNKKGVAAFISYPFTLWGIIDLISILPGLISLNKGFKLLRLFRVFKSFKVFRIFKAFRYSKNILIVLKVIKNSKEALMTVCGFAIGYIFISALIVFNVETETFTTFFDAIYWATVSLTTVGYGDIYPVSTAGRVITMVSSIFGIAVVALPAGIITAGYMDAINEKEQ